MRHSMVQTATRSEVTEASLRPSAVKDIDPVIANNPTFDSTEIPVEDHVVRNVRVVVNYEKPTSSVVRKSNRVIGENGYTCLTKNKKIQKARFRNNVRAIVNLSIKKILTNLL